jgi:hypothetical protein
MKTTRVIGFVDRARKVVSTRAWKSVINGSPALFCILLTLVCISTASATPPSTPIELDLELSQPPRLSECYSYYYREELLGRA